MTPRDPMSTTNTNDSPNGPRDSLSDYEFSFETYLDYKSRIEIDVSLRQNDGAVASWMLTFLIVKSLDHMRYILRSLDSLYGRDTASVAESIYEFHKENGRTYHAYRAGWSGCWAIDMGDEFPEARIIGTDLSPIQANLVPPNVEFIIDDAATLGCWSDMKTQIIEPAFERLKPGGWLECQELMGLLESDDDSLTDKNPFKVWCDNIVEASILANRPLNFAASMKQWFIEAGFVDVTEKVYKLPLNGWPKDRRLKRFGELWHANMGWTKEQIEVNLVDVRKALADQRMHSYEKFYVVYGRKPETA
ncbi:S-adenosyl-L-methionine-dependent methyltransferase [Fusarium oxysporum f. sp. albedinis]|nr:S-adenosyl-L-methionine-dependent methyltransferase [Fusarium oxysporum f. sp. albedinis]